MPFSNQRQAWGEAVRARRAELGLSQRELARRADIDPGHMAKVEAGSAGLSEDSKFRLARALERQVAEIFTYPDTSEAS